MASILIVEDDAPLRTTLGLCLQARGHTVRTAESAEAVLADPPSGLDLVITDFRLPEADGLRFLRELRSRIPGLRFILITGFPSFGLEARAKALGVSACLAKPFKLEDLFGQIDHLLNPTPRPESPSP